MPAPLPDLSGRTILVVDDNADALYVLQTLLAACGAIVLAAPNALAALGDLQAARVDVIVSDLSMPQIDGLEFIERIRKLPGMRDTPAIALTAFPKDYASATATFAGFDLFIQKPVDIDGLCAAIMQLLERRPKE